MALETQVLRRDPTFAVIGPYNVVACVVRRKCRDDGNIFPSTVSRLPRVEHKQECDRKHQEFSAARLSARL